MAALKRVIRRFGGRHYVDYLNANIRQNREAEDTDMARIDAVLKAIEADLDVQARRRINWN